MEQFTKLFGKLLVLVYHCFDRIVIHGYLSGLSRPQYAVHFLFLRQLVGVPRLSAEVLFMVVGRAGVAFWPRYALDRSGSYFASGVAS